MRPDGQEVTTRSVAVTSGTPATGLPVGIQVVTPFLRDRDALALAGLIADVAGGYEVPPG